MEVVRTPQLREARRLQTRREQLEKQIYDLQQQEQKMVATAAATSSMSTPGQLNIARREERQQPLACIMGRGKYLVPQLEASPQCPHSKTTHGANRMMSYQRCLDCQQEQQMPLTPLKDLQHWNHNLAFLQTDFLKRMVNLELEKKKQEATGSLGAQPKGLAKAQPKSVAKATAVKSRAQPVPTLIEPKDEEEETFLNNAVFIGDEEDMVMEQYTNPPPQQPCSRCQRGLVSLMRDTANQQLVWNCNNPACAFCCPDVNDILEPAQGVFPVSTMPSGGAVADQCGRSAGRDPASVLQLRASDLHVRDGSGVLQTGQIPGGEARLGYWMKDGNPHLETDENLGLNKSYDQIIEALDVDPLTTYVAIGYGDFVKGLTSVVTMPVISRRIILTKNGDGFWLQSTCPTSLAMTTSLARQCTTWSSMSSPRSLSATWWMWSLRMKRL